MRMKIEVEETKMMIEVKKTFANLLEYSTRIDYFAEYAVLKCSDYDIFCVRYYDDDINFKVSTDRNNKIVEMIKSKNIDDIIK